MINKIKNLKVFGLLRMKSGEGNALWHLPSLLLCSLAVIAALMTGCADEVEMYDAAGKDEAEMYDAAGKDEAEMYDAAGKDEAEMRSADGKAGEVGAGVKGEVEADGTGEVEEGKAGEVEFDGTIMVHMCGAVVNPGVYELEKGSRIVDGVRCAGGFTEEADEDAINLSRVLDDQVRVYIPTKAETESYAAAYELTGTYSEQPDAGGGEGSGLININTANIEKLEQIPGIGASKAKSIVAYREKNGAFKNIEDIKKVSGIGDATFENMKDMITVN
ncbi:MAG: helix-hairpin-helix domain-containing protein [Lachnospiraceae bacterium]|nr:helix-hairpin-helix domain-containing protein [Lachnospiraceae bacterium]